MSRLAVVSLVALLWPDWTAYAAALVWLLWWKLALVLLAGSLPNLLAWHHWRMSVVRRVSERQRTLIP